MAAICHGGWIPISAGVYRGVRVTGSPGIKDDLVNAGALWEDAPVVVDRHFVSSRKPDDLPDFLPGDSGSARGIRLLILKFKKAIVAFLNLAKCRAELRTARKNSDTVAVFGHPLRGLLRPGHICPGTAADYTVGQGRGGRIPR